MTPDQWARVRELFAEALDLPEEARREHVAGRDVEPAIRGEVLRLLASHDTAGAFLEQSPLSLTGRRIGRYTVGRRLGCGGMGEVYLAHDGELHRDVAIKVSTLPDDDGRLRREAQRASRLNHPSICTIHEVGEFDGRAFIVMEYIDGRSLAEITPATGLPAEQVRRYGAQVAGALAHAHERGVVHRDLKASNVMVTTDFRVKVLDFGLALDVAGVPEAVSRVSQSLGTDEFTAGTLSCMAPELLRGEAASPATDVWALGVLLHQMLAGTPPFSGATAFELSGAVLHEPAAPLPADVPADLTATVGRCLEKVPGQRWPRCVDVCRALETGAEEVGVVKTQSWRPSASAAALVLLFLFLAGLWWRGLFTPASDGSGDRAARPVLAVLAFEVGGLEPESAWLSTGVQSMLLTGLAQAPGVTLVSAQRLHEAARATGAGAFDTLDRAKAAEVARYAGAAAVVVGSIAKSGSVVRLDARVENLQDGRVLVARSVSGSDVFALADELASRVLEGVGLPSTGQRPVAEVSSPSLEAYRMYSQGLDAFANYRLDAAREALRAAVGLDPAFAEAYLQLALLGGQGGRAVDRREYLRKAAEHQGRLTEGRRLLMGVELAREAGRYAEAAERLGELRARFPDVEAIAMLAGQMHWPVVGPLPDTTKLLDLTHAVVEANPSSALARNSYGYALATVGRFPAAIAELETYARLAPREPNPYDTLGEVYLRMGALDKAVEAYSRATSIDPTFNLGGRAWCWAIAGRLDDAIREPGAPDYLQAVLLARAGRYREASQVLKRAEAAWAAGGDPARLAALHTLEAMLALERGAHAEAGRALASADTALAAVPRERGRVIVAIRSLLGRLVDLRSGAVAEVEGRIPPPGGASDPNSPEVWVPAMLQGEMALARNDLESAAAAFASGRPVTRVFFSRLAEGTVLVNDLLSRDGQARVEVARGNFQGAIAAYRRLLSPDPSQPWVAIFEPRYVLAIARLQEQSGDRTGALSEYRRFLRCWQHADRDLPELREARDAVTRLAR